MTALNLTHEQENIADLKASFRALLIDNTRLPAAKRDMLADALIIYVKCWLERAALAQSPVSAEGLTDAAMLDWLERMGNEPEGLLLHDGGDFTGRRGLGLRRIGRSLRQAIAQAYSPATDKEQT